MNPHRYNGRYVSPFDQEVFRKVGLWRHVRRLKLSEIQKRLKEEQKAGLIKGPVPSYVTLNIWCNKGCQTIDRMRAINPTFSKMAQ